MKPRPMPWPLNRLWFGWVLVTLMWLPVALFGAATWSWVTDSEDRSPWVYVLIGAALGALAQYALNATIAHGRWQRTMGQRHGGGTHT